MRRLFYYPFFAILPLKVVQNFGFARFLPAWRRRVFCEPAYCGSALWVRPAKQILWPERCPWCNTIYARRDPSARRAVWLVRGLHKIRLKIALSYCLTLLIYSIGFNQK